MPFSPVCMLKRIARRRPGMASTCGLLFYVAIVIFAGYALLWLAYQTPGDMLRKNILKAYSDGYFSENHPRRSPDLTIGKRFDMWTECTGIGAALNENPMLDSLLEMRIYGECEELSAAAAQGFAMPPPHQYMRYIHGYIIILRPLYTFFEMRSVRVITSITSVFLLGALFWALRRHVSMPHASIVMFSFLFPYSPSMYIMATHAVQFWVVLFAAISAVAYYGRYAPFRFFGCIGAVDAFMTNLNMGSLSLGLPLLCYVLAAWARDADAEDILAGAFWGSVGWSVGFVLPWLVKWGVLLAAQFATWEDIFSNRVEEYRPRSLGMIALALGRNLSETNLSLWVPLFASLFVRRCVLRLRMPARLWTVAFPALIPLIWICLLPGQSGIKHSSFINLILWPALAAMALFFLPMPKDAGLRAELLRRGGGRRT